MHTNPPLTNWRPFWVRLADHSVELMLAAADLETPWLEFIAEQLESYDSNLAEAFK